jgi:hypothetical protein
MALVLILGLANGKYLLVELNGEEETEASPRKPCNSFECRHTLRIIGGKENTG